MNKILLIFTLGALISCLQTKDNTSSEPLRNTSFSKSLSYNKIKYNISSIKKDDRNYAKISIIGLKEAYKETLEVEEGYTITGAEVSDLDKDKVGELVIYLHSVGSGAYGKVIAVSPNGKHSASEAYFKGIVHNKRLNKGYMGHDKFELINNHLVQSFPIYKKKDTNANPTGGIRYIQYKLVDGENVKVFKVSKNIDR